MHSQEEEVQNWASLDPVKDKEERRTQLLDMKCLGNHEHNLRVLENNEGNLWVVRAPGNNQDAHYSQYVPCHLCLVWFAKSQLYRHSCYKAIDGRRVSMKKSCLLLSLNNEGVSSGMAIVLNGLTKDKVGKAVAGDMLIVEYLRVETAGGCWHAKKCVDQIRSKLRYAGRLLCQLRDDFGNEELSFSEALTSSNFPRIAEAAKNCARDDRHQMGLSETTIKIGQMVSHLVQRKNILAMQAKDYATKEDMADFKTIYNEDWPKLIGKPSRREILFRRRNQKILLPTTAHIKIFSEGLKTRVVDATSKFLEDTSNQTNYRSLQEATLVRMIQFNRRRGQVSDKIMVRYNGVLLVSHLQQVAEPENR